jgi:ribosomal protein S27AE
MASATLIVSPEPDPPASRPDPRRSYSCPECGHVLRVSSVGRHRLYFDPPNTLVMNRVCPACGHGLPGKNAKG